MSQKKSQLINPLSGNINVTGVVTASSFVGDGSGLTGVASTDNIQTATSAKFLSNVNVSGITTLASVSVTGITTLTGTTTIGVVTGGTSVSATHFYGDGAALTGIDATSLKDSGGNIKVQANPNGAVVTGVATATTGSFSGNVTIGGTLTYQDVTNIDSLGIVTAQQGIQVLANGLDVTGFSTFKTGVSVTGVVTATSFVGNLTGNVTGNADTATTATNAQALTGTPDIVVSNVNAGIGTFTALNLVPTVTTFSPADGATNVSVTTNIVLTVAQTMRKGTGNITIRSGSASGTILETIAVTADAVTISGGVITINPTSNLPFNTNVFVVIPAGAFEGVFGNQLAAIDTYDFTTATLALGDAYEGGFLICCASNTFWIVAPASTEVSRIWPARADATTTAQANAACGDWFVPSRAQLQNPGYTCRTYWDSYTNDIYWTNTEEFPGSGCYVNFSNGNADGANKTDTNEVRAFRTVSY